METRDSVMSKNIYSNKHGVRGMLGDRQTIKPKCPRCGENSYIVSIFGSICSNCFYDPSKDGDLDEPSTQPTPTKQEEKEWVVSVVLTNLMEINKMNKYKITIGKFVDKTANGYDNFETIYEQKVAGDDTIVSSILSVVLNYISNIEVESISSKSDGDK